MGKQWKQCQTLFWGSPKSLQMLIAAMKLKDAYSLEGKLWPTYIAYWKAETLLWLGVGGEGDDREWDGWMASPTQWTWVWVDPRSWWWTGRPGMLWFMVSKASVLWGSALNPLFLLFLYLFAMKWWDQEQILPRFLALYSQYNLIWMCKKDVFLSYITNFPWIHSG